ncbi:MAG: hypothetical protein Q9227_001987 [Pyrenula ochraceoflavens]
MRVPLTSRASCVVLLYLFPSSIYGSSPNRFAGNFQKRQDQTVQTCDSDEIYGVFESFTQYSAEYTSQCSSYLSLPEVTTTLGTTDTPIITQYDSTSTITTVFQTITVYGTTFTIPVTQTAYEMVPAAMPRVQKKAAVPAITPPPLALRNLKARQDETPEQHSEDLSLRSRLSSACSCLDIPLSTTGVYVTPPTSTQTVHRVVRTIATQNQTVTSGSTSVQTTIYVTSYLTANVTQTGYPITGSTSVAGQSLTASGSESVSSISAFSTTAVFTSISDMTYTTVIGNTESLSGLSSSIGSTGLGPVGNATTTPSSLAPVISESFTSESSAAPFSTTAIFTSNSYATYTTIIPDTESLTRSSSSSGIIQSSLIGNATTLSTFSSSETVAASGVTNSSDIPLVARSTSSSATIPENSSATVAQSIPLSASASIGTNSAALPNVTLSGSSGATAITTPIESLASSVGNSTPGPTQSTSLNTGSSSLSATATSGTNTTSTISSAVITPTSTTIPNRTIAL